MPGGSRSSQAVCRQARRSWAAAALSTARNTARLRSGAPRLDAPERLRYGLHIVTLRNGPIPGDNDYCPIRATLQLLGQKWIPLIVYELRGGKRRFNELATVIGGCNSRTLRDRL